MSFGRILDRQTDSFALLKSVRESSGKDISKNPLVEGIRTRLRRQQDARILVTGESGIGKSAFALRLGEELDPDLYVKEIERAVELGISFNALQFMDSTELPNGSLLDFDEPGQGWFHRDFMSQASKMLAQTFIGMRFQQHITVLTIPNVSLLDIDAVRLLNYHVHIEKQGYATVYRMLDQRFGGDPWRKVEVDTMKFGLPDTKLWHRYEKKKFAFQKELYAKFRKELKDSSAPKLTNSDIMDIIMEDLDGFLVPVKPDDKGPPKVSYAAIENGFGVGHGRAYAIKEGIAQRIRVKEGNRAKSS